MHCLCLQVAFGVIPWPRTNECLITLTFELMGTYWGYGYEFLSFDPVNTRYRKQNHHRVSFFTAHPLCNSLVSLNTDTFLSQFCLINPGLYCNFLTDKSSQAVTFLPVSKLLIMQNIKY